MLIKAPLKISYPSPEDQKTYANNIVLSFSVMENLIYLHRGGKLLALGLAGDEFSVEQVKADLKSRKRWHKAIFVEGMPQDITEMELWGTSFQRRVWEALLAIPSGETRTYGEISVQAGFPHAHRAVGTAIGQNPISIFVPCHRVLPKSGGIGNYYWGAEVKKRLLGEE